MTPAPPGVTDVTLAIELPAMIRMIVSNVTGIAYAERKMAITPMLAIHETASGVTTRRKYARGCERIWPPSFA